MGGGRLAVAMGCHFHTIHINGHKCTEFSDYRTTKHILCMYSCVATLRLGPVFHLDFCLGWGGVVWAFWGDLSHISCSVCPHEYYFLFTERVSRITKNEE